MKCLALLLSLSAFAVGLAHGETSSSICGTLIPCGSYSVVDTYGGHPITREFNFTPIDATTVQLEMAAVDNGVRTASQQLFKFSANGLFTLEKDGQTVGAGVCWENFCSIGTPPFRSNGDLGAQALIFRFTPTAMQLLKLHVDSSGKVIHTDSTINKLP